MNPGRRSGRTLLFLLVLAAAFAAGAALILRENARAGQIVAQEDAALSALRAIAAAEARHHADTGRYAGLDDLAAAGHLRGVVLAGAGAERHAHVPGYRIDVLLPTQKQAGRVVWLTPDAAHANPDLVTRHVAVVARPTEPGRSGFRTFYWDEGGPTRLSEGVSDERARFRNPLPAVHLSTALDADTSGRTWLDLEALTPDGDPIPDLDLTD